MTTSTALATTVHSLEDLRSIAAMLAMSNYFDAKGNSEQAIAQIATKILAGQEIGYGPFASVQGIHVIQGKPAMSANLMAAAVKASARYDYRVRQMDDSAVSIEFFERVASNGGVKLESLGVSTFTAEDAKKAGTQNMAKYGRNMMFSRAMSNGVKWYCPDVFSGNAMYTPEEMGAPVNGDGEIIETTYTVTQPAPTATPAAPNGHTNGNGNGHSDQSAVDLPPEVKLWSGPQDAYDWAVGIGASENVFSARSAFANAVNAYGGKLNKTNAAQIYLSFYQERMARAQEKLAQPADVSDATAEEGAALWA